MLGLVFTEFVECVETNFGLETTDQIQRSCPFATSFTAVDIYDHEKLVTMVSKLHEVSGVPVESLIRTFGHHMFSSFLKTRSEAFVGVSTTAELMCKVEDVIHLEVRSIYPDAELPRFSFPSPPHVASFCIEYQSSRPFADLAHGIIEASIQHFGEKLTIERTDLSNPPGKHALFVLRDF